MANSQKSLPSSFMTQSAKNDLIRDLERVLDGVRKMPVCVSCWDCIFRITNYEHGEEVHWCNGWPGDNNRLTPQIMAMGCEKHSSDADIPF